MQAFLTCPMPCKAASGGYGKPPYDYEDDDEDDSRRR